MTDQEFATKLEALRPELARYARHLTTSRDQAEDLLQDTLVRAWEYRGRLRDNMGAYIRRILYTLFVNQNRKPSPLVPLADIPAESQMMCDDRQDIARQVEMQDVVRRALLNPAVRQNLDFLQSGLGPNDYADSVGLPRPTVRGRVSRMRRRMAQEEAA